VTKDGVDPLLPYEENVGALLEGSTKSMVDSAIEPTVVTELDKNHKHPKQIASSIAFSESGHASSLKSDVFSNAVITSMSSKSSVVDSVERLEVPADQEYHIPEVAGLDSDIRSVVSDADDIHSLSPTEEHAKKPSQKNTLAFF
jgi:hypothetical protein